MTDRLKDRVAADRAELLLMVVALDDSGLGTNRLLAILKDQPDAVIKREFYNVAGSLECAGFVE